MLGLGVYLTSNPDLCPFNTFGEIEQIVMRKRACTAPIAFLVFIGAGNVNGIEAFVFPDGCGDKSDFEFMCWLICHDANS